jgi:hypothetical protein
MTIDTNVRKLDLSNQSLKEIPEELFKCKKLRKLNLSGNQISKIPKEIENLKGLSVLDLSNNKIKNIYAPICNLKNLKILILNRNNIQRLPKQMQFLSKLKILGLANNRLTELPLEIQYMTSLEELNISNNPFKQFPMQLEKLKEKLKRLWIHGYDVDFQNNKELSLISHLSFKLKVYSDDLGLVHDLTGIDDVFEPVVNHFEKIISTAEKSANRKMEKEQKQKKLSQNEKPTVFISYSHADKKWFDRLMEHLSSLESITESEIRVWSDQELKGGDNITEEIEKALNSAKVAILMFSNNYLSSDFIRSKEIPPLIEKAEKEGTTIKPILVRKCLYQKLPYFKDILALNDIKKPLNGMTEDQYDDVFNTLNEEILELLEAEIKPF